jgi:parallel beta-helix repeat protein
MILCVAPQLAIPAHAGWIGTDWLYRKPITVDPSKVLSDQTDFPVLINLTNDTDLQSHAQPDGDDILFTSSDGLTQLSHEIEWYDGGTGSLIAWVKVPELSGSASTTLYLYYGNGSVGPQEDGANVWISDFSGVWHLHEEQAGTGNSGLYRDSSFPFSHGNDNTAATGKDGKVGRGQEFGGDGDYISVPHHANLNLTGPMTLSFWLKLSTETGTFHRVVEKGMWGYTNAYYFGGGNGTNDITYYLNDTEVFDTADSILSTGVWHHVAVTYASNGDATFILDGTAMPPVNYSGTIAGNTDTLYVSHPDTTYDLEGFVDEIRIAAADLTPDWIITEYNNQSEPDSFYTLGSASRIVRGRVFEDRDFAGIASDWDPAVDLALDSVDVELYDADNGDTLMASVLTAVDGTFTFVGLGDGNYKVRVRSATIGDAFTPPAGGLNASVPGTWPYPLAEMTWGNGAALYGGQDATVDDTDTGDDAGPGDTYVTVSVSGGDVSDVNFGFAYNLIVNTLDDGLADNTRSDQGSLRQFLKNANAIGTAGGTTANYSRFRIPGAGPQMVSTVSVLPVMVETTTLDGDDGVGGRVIVDGTTAGDVTALSLTGSDIVVANLVIQNFLGVSSDGIRIHDGTDRNTISNCLIQGMNQDGIRVDWLGADTDLDHVITNCTVSGSGHDGIVLVNVDGISVTNCIIESSTRHGMNIVGANNGSGNNLIASNTIRGNGSRGVSIWDNGSSGNIFHTNIIHSNYYDGVQVGSGGNNTNIYHNVFYNNGTSGNGSGVIVSSGVTGVIARNNLFTNNNRYGLNDVDGGASTSIDYCGFYGNGTAACNYDCLTGSQNIASDPQYASPGPPTNFGLTECTSPAIHAGIDLGADQPDLNGPDAGNYNGPAPDIGAIETSCDAVYAISGRVFEDAVIAAGTGEPFSSGEGDRGLSGARVELFDGSNVFRSFTTTDGSGNYAFPGLSGGTYKIRVVAASLDAGVGALPEQTFESDGATDYGTFGTAMGGQDALAADTTAQSTLTSAEHWVAVSVGAADVTGVDFGFSYELVVNTNDDGQGSFRRFIDNANAIAGVQTSRFNIPTTDPNYTASPLAYVIQPDSSLPQITDATIVDGTTQPDFGATPVIVLDGMQAGVGASGLRIGAGASTVRGLVIHRFTASGIYVTTSGGNTIESNYIGTDVTGLLDRGNGAHGIHIDADTGGNTIGGATAAKRNLISGNAANGIFLQGSSANTVWGNYVGADTNGAPNLGNGGHGILIDGGDDNAVGGSAPGERNLITGNLGSGVAVTG